MILEDIGLALLEPLARLWENFILVMPGLIAGLLILVVGYFIGAVVGSIVKKLFVKIELDKWVIEKTHMKKLSGQFQLANFFGLLTKWYVFILFLTPAAQLIRLDGLTAFLTGLSLWIPNLIAAIVIGLFGFIAAEYVVLEVRDIKAKGAAIIAQVARWIILLFTTIIALKQVGIDVAVAENSFLILLSGVVFAVALALGLGFGLGLKEEAKAQIKILKKKL